MAYQIKISIKDIEPLIWRRLKIPGNITFEELHRIIQETFGWLNYHLYNFDFGDTVIAIPDDNYGPGELYGEDITELDPKLTSIDQFFNTFDSVNYEYDFGDSWIHEIIIEKRLKETKKKMIPVCLGGKRSRPPEDVGGTRGYENFLKIIKDKHNPERKEMLPWAQKDTEGRLFNPEYFYLEEINCRLDYVLQDNYEAAKKLFENEMGLAGKLEHGWYGPYVEVDGEKYSWKRLGKLVSLLDDNQKINIRISKGRL